MDQSPNKSSPSLSSNFVQHIRECLDKRKIANICIALFSVETIDESTRRIYLTCLTPPPLSPSTVSSFFLTPILVPPSPTRSFLMTFRVPGTQSSITYAVPIIKQSEEKETADGKYVSVYVHRTSFIRKMLAIYTQK